MGQRMRWSAVVAALVAATACAKTAQQYLDSGNKYFEARKYKEAIVQYRNAVAKEPRSGQAHTKLADAYFAIGEGAAALREYVRAADLLPNDPSAQLTAARFLMMAAQFEEAQTRAQRVLARDPRNVDAQIIRANSFAGLKDIDGAIAEIAQALVLDPSRAPTYSNLGYLQLAKGNREEAEAAFKKAVAVDPKSVAGRLALANYYWAESRLKEAEEALKAALAADPFSIVANRALAMFYMTMNRAADAEAPLKIVAERSPDAAPKLTLADYYVTIGRVQDARKILEPLARADESYADATLRLASIAYLEKRRDEAYKLTAAVLGRQPKNASAMLTESRFLIADGKQEEGLARAKAAAAVEPRSVPAHLLVGTIQESRHDIDEAIAAFNEGLRLSPRHPVATTELAKLYLMKGDSATAVQFADELVKDRPTLDARLLLARALTAHRDFQEAEKILTSLAREFPRSAPVQIQVGTIAGLTGDSAGARRAFESAERLEPANVEALRGLVAVDLGERRAPQAAARIQEFLKQNGDDPAVLVLLARTQIVSGDPGSAEKVLKQVVSSSASAIDAYGLLAQLYLNQHRLDEALGQFEQVAARDPKSVSARTFSGIILELQDKIDLARQKYEKALDLDPHAAVAANNLAWIYVEHGGNLDVALQLAQTAKAQLPDQPEVNDTLGWIYCRKGLPALAIPRLLESVQNAPKNPDYLFHLGMAYAKAGDKDKAKATLERALTASANFSGVEEAKRTLASLKS